MCAIQYLRSGTQTDYHVTVRAQSPATSIRAQLAAPRRGISGGEARCFWARACEAVPIEALVTEIYNWQGEKITYYMIIEYYIINIV